jgi:hypothetical protein
VLGLFAAFAVMLLILQTQIFTAKCAKDCAKAAKRERGGGKMSNSVWSYLDPLSLLVIILTLVLFVIALFVNGFSHDLLQECGVFLVSVKLIMMSHKNGVSARMAEERLAKIQNLLQPDRG